MAVHLAWREGEVILTRKRVPYLASARTSVQSVTQVHGGHARGGKTCATATKTQRGRAPTAQGRTHQHALTAPCGRRESKRGRSDAETDNEEIFTMPDESLPPFVTHRPTRTEAIQTSQAAVFRLQRLTHGRSSHDTHMGSCRGPHPWTITEARVSPTNINSQGRSEHAPAPQRSGL